MTPKETNNNLPEEEIELIAKKLKKLEPGFLPYSIFLEIARIYVTPIVEVVPFRKNKDGSISVLLTQREKTDPHWPAMMHTPGTVIRSTDKYGGFESAFERILSEELKGISINEGPVFAFPIFHHSGRGAEASFVHWVSVKGESSVGNFFKINSLPENIVKPQISFIKKAAEHFEKYHSVAGTDLQYFRNS